jgi:hypothetical protein
LLRWISLLADAALLSALGAAGMHQKSFALFLMAVLVASTSTLAVFVATATGDRAE